MIIEHFLEAIYYETEREQAVTKRIEYQDNQVVGALNVLLGEDVATLPDDELLALLNVVLLPWGQLRGDASYQALLEADLNLPRDDTMQQIHDLYATRDLFFTIRERLIDSHSDVLSLTMGDWGLQANAPLVSWDEAGQSLVTDSRLDHPMFAGVRKLLQDYGTSWGVDYSWAVIDPLAHETFYLGDPAAVFPAGTGVLDGQNIPINAGRYRVRFNTRTFEYQFKEIGP